MDRPENHFTKLRYEALGRLIDSWMAMDDMATSQIPAINAIVNSPLLTIVFMYAEYAFFRSGECLPPRCNSSFASATDREHLLDLVDDLKVNLSRGRYSATRSSL